MFRRWSIIPTCPGLPGTAFAPHYFATKRAAVGHARRSRMLCNLFDYRLRNERTGEEVNI